MATNLPGTKIATRLLTRPEGATMDEIIAATGGPQYNLLKRLEGQGYSVRKVRTGHSTRYFASPPATRSHETTVTSKGQITIPAEIRQHLGVREGDKLRMTVEPDGRVVVSPVELSIRRMFGMLGNPRRSLTLEEIDDAIADAAVERFRRATR
jgi:AbrB family looped-hinge helix DNA binding protein